MKKTKFIVLATGMMFALNVTSIQADLKPIELTPEAQQDAQKIVDLAKTNQMEAINELTTLYKKYKKNEDQLTGIGQIFLKAGLPQPALEIATFAYQRKSDYLPAIILQGDAFAALKNSGDAAGKYEEATNVDPKEKEPYFRMVDIYKTIAPELALEKLNIIKKEFPNDPAINKAMGSIYYHQNKIDDAIKSYETYLAGQGNDTEALTEYAILMFIKKDFQKSLDISNKVLASEPKSLPATRMKFYDLMELSKTTDAKAASDNFFGKFDESLYNSTDYKYFAQLADSLNDPQLSVQAYEKAVKLDPKKAELYKNLSEAYQKTNQIDSAVAAIQKFGNLNSPQTVAMNNFRAGRIYYTAAANDKDKEIQKHFVEEGDKIFAIVSEKAPDSYMGPFWRGRIQTILDPDNPIDAIKQQYDEALKRLEGKDDSYDSYREECYVYDAFYNFKHDKYAAALESANKVLAIDPDHKLAKQIKNAAMQLKK